MTYQSYSALTSEMNRTWRGIGKCGVTNDGGVAQIQKNIGTGEYRIDQKTKLPIATGKSFAITAHKFNELVKDNKISGIDSNGVVERQINNNALGDDDRQERISNALKSMVALSKQLQETIKKRKVSLSDALDFLGDIKDLYSAVSDYEQAYDDFIMLDDAEQAEIIKLIYDTLELHQDQEKTIVAAYKFIHAAISLYESVKVFSHKS